MTQTKEPKTYVCRKIYLYRLLTERGFEPFKVAPDKWDCKRLVWLYADSPELRAVVEEYYASKQASV